MSECSGPGCTHPEHINPATVTALDYQHRMTHSGDRAAAQVEENRRRQVVVLQELFGGGGPLEPPMMLRRAELAALRERLRR
jgi:hypothetical protein